MFSGSLSGRSEFAPETPSLTCLAFAPIHDHTCGMNRPRCWDCSERIANIARVMPCLGPGRGERHLALGAADAPGSVQTRTPQLQYLYAMVCIQVRTVWSAAYTVPQTPWHASKPPTTAPCLEGSTRAGFSRYSLQKVQQVGESAPLWTLDAGLDSGVSTRAGADLIALGHGPDASHATTRRSVQVPRPPGGTQSQSGQAYRLVELLASELSLSCSWRGTQSLLTATLSTL